jgi:hypothetical protein
VSVGDYDGVPLNEIIEFEFSSPLDPDTVRADTIQIREGPNYGKQVPGYFEVDDKKVYFYPRLPTQPDLSDGGLKASTDYQIIMPGKPDVAVLRDYLNNRMQKETRVNFRTAAAGSPNLFRDNFIDGLPPQVLFMNPPNGAEGVPADSDITLTFNRRPLHPATITTSNISLTMIERMGVKVNRPISGVPTLIQSHDSVVIRYIPTFPLADDAWYRLEVDRRVQDLVGNDIDPSWIAEFSIRDEPPRFADIHWTYNEAEKLTQMDTENTTASWNEAEQDALAALFTVAGGNGTAGDLKPLANQQFDPADFPRGHEVVSEDGVDYDVYNFRTIEIPQGVTVRFAPLSSNPERPAKLLALKPIILDGTLTVSGGDGTDAETSGTNTKLVVAQGGDGGPGGTQGADSYSGTVIQGAPAQDAGDVPNGGEGGGGGGTANATNYCYAGGGGGGGSRTAGKDGTKGGYTQTAWQGAAGKGGKSTEQRGYDANEERTPNTGGAGGGAGGMGYYYYSQWRNGGAGGGGGGGAITIQGASTVNIGSTGKILANGGIGGDTRAQSYYGGASGGGAGGSVLIRATGIMNFGPGSTISVAGGAGGIYSWTYTYYQGGEGGDGGTGYIRLEAEISTGVFAPVGGGAPSVGQTLWQNLGVFDPIMINPKVEDINATLFNDSMFIEVQMAIEDQNNLGNPNLNSMDVTDSDGDGEYDDTLDDTKLTEWTKLSNIESLNGNGFQYLRTRITFQLDDNQTADHPLPYLDDLTINFKF